MSDYETTQKKRNIIVGLFVIAATCALVGLIFKFGDLPVFVSRWKSFEVRVQFPTASGVQENTAVQFCGYQIGRVIDVERPEVTKDLNTGQLYHQTVVVLNIDSQYDNIPADVEVKLMTRGLGSSYIEFKAQPSDVRQSDREFLGAGSLLQGSTGMTSEFFPEDSMKKLDELVDGLSTFINNANDILGDKTSKENLKSSLSNLSEAIKQAAQTLKEFQEFSAAATATLKNTDARIEKVVTATISTSEELSKTVAALRVILEKVSYGQGTAARLINDGRLYENLLEDTESLKALMGELTLFIAKLNEKGIKIKL